MPLLLVDGLAKLNLRDVDRILGPDLVDVVVELSHLGDDRAVLVTSEGETRFDSPEDAHLSTDLRHFGRDAKVDGDVAEERYGIDTRYSQELVVPTIVDALDLVDGLGLHSANLLRNVLSQCNQFLRHD